MLMILICAAWIALWILKPTNLWTKIWHEAEDRARPTLFGYYGLNFAVSTFPVIALAIIGFIYLHLLPRKPRIRQARSSATALSNPLVVNSIVGILSSFEILLVFLFVIFLVWTYYARISNDFKKLMPVKSLKLNTWQLKYLRVATRFGLLAEACLALLLLPILRGLSLFRLLGIQFEASVRYHIWLGTAMIFFATIHGGSTLFVWGVSQHIQDEMWRWQKTGRIYLAGEIALVTGLVMWITSLPQIRRKKFEFFYYTHHLYIIFLIFFLFHAGDRHFYMVFGGIFLFGLDKLLRFIQSRPEACILSARVFPSKAIELILPKHAGKASSPCKVTFMRNIYTTPKFFVIPIAGLKFTPTSVIFMKIPSISKFQWHSFSITSSSSVDDQTMSLVVKCEGEWTSSLYQMIHAELDSDADQMRCIPVAIEGPYGPATMDFLRYDSLLLVAGGIGITPFLSILQEIASAQSNRKYRFPSKVQLIYVIKSSQEICLLNSISPLLSNQPSKKWHLTLKVFVTQEEQSSVTVREVLNDLSLVRAVRFGTQSNYAVNGLESLIWMAALVGITSILFVIFLISLNHIFVPVEKKLPSEKLAAPSEKVVSKEKTPSWVADLIILSSFIIAITGSTLMAILLRWRRLKKQTPPVSLNQGKAVQVLGPIEEEHEINFGGRPNFEEIFSELEKETAGSDIGVLVCGPESMKESVAKTSQRKSQCFMMNANKDKPYFNFHSLNFTF
ncbi:Ferric reduction oxidase 8 [Citrus sinensis]|uniref:Ferric reduction oxidase 8 n=1 Tax=Citrus sinensis TaxID=2711 RepID=A0ACB8LS60_CITSI|nr:Ferric reduction oxidase 8 [Citrus sinensis]